MSSMRHIIIKLSKIQCLKQILWKCYVALVSMTILYRPRVQLNVGAYDTMNSCNCYFDVQNSKASCHTDPLSSYMSLMLRWIWNVWKKCDWSHTELPMKPIYRYLCEWAVWSHVYIPKANTQYYFLQQMWLAIIPRSDSKTMWVTCRKPIEPLRFPTLNTHNSVHISPLCKSTAWKHHNASVKHQPKVNQCYCQTVK